MNPLSLVFFLTLLVSVERSQCQRLLGNNRRQAVINEWIRTIREAPKGHSMSPSWTSKARPQVIGVGELPLQNEAVPVQPQVPNRLYKNSQSPIQSNRFKRYPGKSCVWKWDFFIDFPTMCKYRKCFRFSTLGLRIFEGWKSYQIVIKSWLENWVFFSWLLH